MSRRGRRPILNDVKKAEILAVLTCGCSWRTAANYVGCDVKTLFNTAERDPEFAKQLESREAASEVAQLANIRNAGKETRYWRASAWHLERIAPERYARRDLETVTREELDRILIAHAKMMVEEVPVARYRKQIIKRVQKMIANSPSSMEKRYKRRKNSLEREREFAEILQPEPADEPEKPQNPREKMQGTIPACNDIAVIQAPN